MPFLLGDQIVARVDIKADRRNGVLRVLAAFVEEGHDPSRIVGPLRRELRELADWIGVAEVQVDDRGSLGPSLAVTRPPAHATFR
jgi:uncharacterized protein YcaQ